MATDLETVRLLIADTPVEEADRLLTDDQLQIFLGLNDGNVRRAAAEALETIATSEALISKKIQTQDLSTDGPAVANALLARAKNLRDLAADEGDGDDFGFEIVDGIKCLRPPELTEYDHQYWGL